MFPANFQKILKHDISRKCVLWELSCSMRTIRLTDRQNGANNRFSKYCETA